MSITDGPPQTPASLPARRRWPVWVFLAMVASPAVVWLLPARPPAPPPPLPPGWVRLTTVDDGLSVDLPAAPLKAGPVETFNGGSDTSWSCVVDGYTYGVRRQVCGIFPAEPNPKPDDMMNGFCHGLAGGLGLDESAWQPVTVGGRPGRELRYRGATAASDMRVVQVGRTLYFFLVGAPTPDASLDEPEVKNFLDSVRFGR